MSSTAARVLSCIVLARAVNHYYWVHTPDSEASGSVSVENLQRIIERMTRLPVKKVEVEFEGTIVRGVFERYPDHIRIYIRKGMPPTEARFTVVKELCHSLADEESEYSADGVDTISHLVKYRGLPFDGKETEAARSERFAEFLALELLYPIEHRAGDKKAIYDDKTATIAEISAKRGVPGYLVVGALEKEYLKACQDAWALVTQEVKFDPLKPLE